MPTPARSPSAAPSASSTPRRPGATPADARSSRRTGKRSAPSPAEPCPAPSPSPTAPGPRSASGRGSTAARSPRRSPNGRPLPPPPDPRRAASSTASRTRPSTRGADDPGLHQPRRQLLRLRRHRLRQRRQRLVQLRRSRLPLAFPVPIADSPLRHRGPPCPWSSQNPRVGGPRSAQQRLPPSAKRHGTPPPECSLTKDLSHTQAHSYGSVGYRTFAR